MAALSKLRMEGLPSQVSLQLEHVRYKVSITLHSI